MGKVSKFKKIRRMASNMPELALKGRKEPVNHERQMKQMYYKYGPAGVRAYVTAVDTHINAKA